MSLPERDVDDALSIAEGTDWRSDRVNATDATLRPRFRVIRSSHEMHLCEIETAGKVHALDALLAMVFSCTPEGLAMCDGELEFSL